MRPLKEAPAERLRAVRFVLTDMDDTLTFRGRLSARTYTALERLRDAGIAVIPVTAAPAGWCDQMARMWPVDGVIGENGGFHFRGTGGPDGVSRRFWHGDAGRDESAARLAALERDIRTALPQATTASDQPFRLTSLAFDRPANESARAALVDLFRRAGARVTVNSLWVLGWFGAYDKLTMARRVMADSYGVDIDAHGDGILYVGDSTNDAPMFSFFANSVGVSTVVHFLPEIPTPPAWITDGPGGDGFVEVADALLHAQAGHW